MRGEITQVEPDGHDSAEESAQLNPQSGLAELSALARVSSQPLIPIPDNLPPEIRDFAQTLRVLFGSLDMSLNRLAALLHSDPGTVSRYLSGKRIPPPGFIDDLCKAVYDARGALVTAQVQEVVHEQFLVALRTHNPARYEVQRLTDLLQVAAQEKLQYETTVTALQEAIANRNDKIYALELEGRQLRAAWARAEGLLEEERKQREDLQQTIASLYAEVSYFKEQLLAAQRRAAKAEERCRELEVRLDTAGGLLQEQEEDQGTAPMWGRARRGPAVGDGRRGTGPQQLKIVTWGTPGSGKSTFLAALDIALKSRPYGFHMEGRNDASTEMLIEMTNQLIVEREFPVATTSIDMFAWDLFKNQQPTAEPNAVTLTHDPDRISLSIVDPSGEIIGTGYRGAPERKRLIDDLVDSDGVLFMFDAIREFEIGDSFSTANSLLHQIVAEVGSRRGDLFDGTLPQHAAICITKFDEPKVLMTAKKLGLLKEDPRDPSRSPRVDDDDASRLLSALTAHTSNEYGGMLLDTLNQVFPGRLRFFVTSAVGFYVNPRTGRYDEDDPQNLVKSFNVPGRARIRGRIAPINVAEPILWLSQQVYRHS